jgi:drug/metabolite transporter (DMT)-like permease/HAMP domain-containing protein
LRAERLRPYYYIAAGVILQGLSPVLTKLLLDDLTPATVVGARYLIAVLFLLPFGWRHSSEREHQPPRPRDWVALVLVGALGSGVASLLFTRAIDLTSVGIATSLSKTAPIFVAFFAYFTLKERVTSARLLLVALMVAADVLIGAGEMRWGAEAGQRLVGDAMAIGAGALRAMAEILSKTSLRRFFPSTVALWRFGIGFLVTGFIAAVTGDFRALALLDTRAWMMLLILGVFCTSLSMTLYYRGLREIPAHVGVTLRLPSAIVTLLLSWVMLGETLNALHISGIAILVAGAYLIIVRTTRHPALSETLERARRPAALGVMQTMRGRVAVMVAAMIALTVGAATILSVQHTRTVVNDQVRLTMAMTATTILQLRGVAQPPSPETYRQYLDRVISHTIVGRFYSVQIAYLIVLDANQNVIAFAKRDDLEIRDPYGRPLPDYSPETALRVLELSQSGELARAQDIVPVSAELQQGGRVVGVVKMGSKRSLANRAAIEVALRNMSLAILLVIIGVAIAYHLTDYLARPLEELSSAVRRISRGELDVPLVPLGSREVASLGSSVSLMTEELRQGRMLRGMLAHMSCPAAQQEGPWPAVSMLARFGGESLPEQERQLQSLLEAVCSNEGRLAGIAPGVVLAVFGSDEPEQDDVLRAVVAALEWRAQWLDAAAATDAAALVDVREDGLPGAERLPALVALLPRASTETIPIYVTAAAAQAAGAHVRLAPTAHEGLRLVAETEEGLPAKELADEVDV